MRNSAGAWGRGTGAATLFVLLGACGGSGGPPPSLEVGFEVAQSALPEGQSVQILLRLTSRVGPLQEPLSFLVRDQGTGTAVGGSDHDFLVLRSFTFPAGSDHGATLLLDLQLLSDGSIEGADETLHLVVSDLPAGVAAGPNARHVLTLQEMDFAEVSFVRTASSTNDEGTPLIVQVELHLDAGETLDTDVQVSVADDGTGTATDGVDYDTVPGRLTFPRGSFDGLRLSFSLNPVEDTLAELDETASLVLKDPSPGLLIRNPIGHTITIPDNDRSEGFLVVSGTLGAGPETLLQSGSSLDMGSTPLGAIPNEVLRITLHNAGALPLDLRPLVLVGNTGDFTVDLDGVGTPRLGLTAIPSPLSLLEEDAVTGVRVHLDPLICGRLESSRGAVRLEGVPLPGGDRVDLRLEPVALPFAADALVQIDGRDVALAGFIEGLTLWRGEVLGNPESSVFLAFSEEATNGWIRRGPAETVHLLTEYSEGFPVVRLLDDTQLAGRGDGTLPVLCQAAPEVPGTAPGPAPPGALAVTQVLGFEPSTCRVAMETDYQYFIRFGTSPRAIQYITSLVAAVGDLFEREIQTSLLLAYLGIHTDPDDGWSTPDLGGEPLDLLLEFRTAWSPAWPVPADLAQFVSGAFLGGGAAYTDALCNTFFGFGVSTDVAGGIDWGNFAGTPNAGNWDFIVVAHELGHGFGAQHTHEYCPPLDHCSSNCAGVSACPQGTLMSYCHICGGIPNLRLGFHPHVSSVMRNSAAASCMAPATLDAGATITLLLGFVPTSGAGPKSVTLVLDHGASNAPQPFRMAVTGTATN